MATYCAGLTVAWNSVPLGEVVDIKVINGGSLPLARSSTYSVDAGTIEIACLSTAAISSGQRGLKASLAITGGGMDFTTKAVCQTLQLVGKVNDIARYSASFKIMKE
jgi:hypothetical protein